MLNNKIKYITMALLVLSSMIFTGCIPKNEHVGKPAPNSYKNNYYDRGYYYYR